MQTIETILQVSTIILVIINYINLKNTQKKLNFAEKKLKIYEGILKNETN